MLQPEEVRRDKYGYWLHSVLTREEYVDKSFTEIPELGDMQIHLVDFETDVPEEMARRYFEAGEPDVTEWQPTSPLGDGWFLISISDSEDGPFACFARPKMGGGDAAEERQMIDEWTSILEGIKAQTPHIVLNIGVQEAVAIIGNLQLALRHPANTGASALAAKRFAQTLIEGLASRDERIKPFLEKGFDPNFDR
ncbi:MAG TPA: hypothetical protein VF708_19885 [Pyrinomonadaceae bacterium]|jgi:hypothetical protein